MGGGGLGEGSAQSCSYWRFVWLATLFWALVGALNPRDFSFSSVLGYPDPPLQLGGGGSGGGVGAVLLHLEICLVGHTVLGAGWSPQP